MNLSDLSGLFAVAAVVAVALAALVAVGYRLRSGRAVAYSSILSSPAGVKTGSSAAP